MRKVHMYVDGMVISVGFREFVKRHADRLKINGYCRNIEGGVEVIAEGEDHCVGELIDLCRDGPSHARVSNVTVEEQPPSFMYTDFSIRP